MGRRRAGDSALAEGELLQFASRAWRVLYRPGHSPSDTMFFDEASGELFGGDHLIKHISSNPLISRPLERLPGEGDGRETGTTCEGVAEDERPRALMIYMDSLRKTREMELEVVYAGHGEPVEDHRVLIDERMKMHERRANRLHKLIASGRAMLMSWRRRCGAMWPSRRPS